MVNRVLKVLVEEELNQFLSRRQGGGTAPQARLGLLTQTDDAAGNNLGEMMVVSLVNLEQERTALNAPLPRDSYKKRPPINLNLYLLFAANHSNYLTALEQLSNTIGFFQSKPLFTPENSPGLPAGVEKVTMELISLNFQELSNFWTAIGSNILPAAIYKLRMISITEDMIVGDISDITTINVKTQKP